MVFSSGVFLFLFLPIVILLHTVVKNIALKNGMLIVASLLFYAYGEPVYIALLIETVFVNYLFGRALSKKKSKVLLGFAVADNILKLAIFKYIPIPGIVMPIGISFFIFQAISYIVDIYRTDEDTKVGFFDVLLYISLFPQLIAGPIVKFNTVKNQIKDRTVTIDGLTRGIRQFIIGLAKKMLIANTMAFAVDRIFAMETSGIGTSLAWLGAVCYVFQIFFDFSGYSDMALGLGSMMGFTFPQNFNYPYIACSIKDFWRRWHMSLTAWFREYLYIPLGGNRKGQARKIFNTMIVFICTGIWHGANWTFVIWGLMHGILMCIEILIFKDKKEYKFNPIKWLYTMLFVIIGFVIFRADSIAYGFSYIGRMFAFTGSQTSFITLMSFMTPVFITTFVVAILASTPIVPVIGKKIKANVITYAFSLVLLLLCIMALAADSYNPFIYFRF